MATIKEKIDSLAKDEVFISLEFFPPKTETVSFNNLKAIRY